MVAGAAGAIAVSLAPCWRCPHGCRQQLRPLSAIVTSADPRHSSWVPYWVPRRPSQARLSHSERRSALWGRRRSQPPLAESDRQSARWGPRHPQSARQWLVRLSGRASLPQPGPGDSRASHIGSAPPPNTAARATPTTILLGLFDSIVIVGTRSFTGDSDVVPPLVRNTCQSGGSRGRALALQAIVAGSVSD